MRTMRALLFLFTTGIALAVGGFAAAHSQGEPARTTAEASARGQGERPRAADDASARAIDQAAVESYRRGDLDGAHSLWLSLLDPGESDGAETSQSASAGGLGQLSSAERARVLYNLGNVAYRKKAVLPAVGWYSAALRLAPRDADVWWNLEHARSEAKLDPADRGDLSGTLRRLLSSLTLSESEWLALAMLLAWSGVLTCEALRGGRLWRRLSLAGALVVAASLAPWLFNVARATEQPLLVIHEGQLDVRSEPRADAPAVAQAAAGDQAEALDALPEWTKIELENGIQGWARKSALFDLKR